MIIPYRDAAQARQVLRELNGRLDSYIKVQKQEADHLVFMDFKQAYGFIRQVGKQLDIALHLKKFPHW